MKRTVQRSSVFASRPSNERSESSAAVDPFASIRASKLFPGRSTLYLHEVAKALSVSVAHIIDLIAEGKLSAVEITGKGNKSSREHWRVPVGDFDRFIEENRSDKKGARRR